MSLGEVTKTENDHKPSNKRKRHFFFSKVKKVFWLIIIIIVIFQGYLIITNFFSKPPNLKMCFDRSTCTGYCPIDSQKECYNLVDTNKHDQEYSFDLLIKGKINIIEFFSENPKYCYCNGLNELNNLEELYDFYKKNN